MSSYNRYGTTKQIPDTFRVIIYARENNPVHNNIIKQLEVCQNFADFYEYEVVGIATEIDTLFKTNIDYDAVMVTQYNRISRELKEFHHIKNQLLKKDKIIIQAVRSN